MTEKKRRVGVLFGGRSAEHEVSLQSAKNVIEAIDREKYEVLLIGIDKTGTWRLNDESSFLLHPDDPKRIELNTSGETITLVCASKGKPLIRLSDGASLETIDVAFPVLHGTFGEDGTVQGLLELAGIPYVGSGVMGSSVAMDKEVTKRLLSHAGLPIPDFLVFSDVNVNDADFEAVTARLGATLFVKPANMGSSVGISKVRNEDEFGPALEKALSYDRKVLVEEYIEGIELECSVLGNESPVASVPGEVIAANAEFYSYEAKYINDDGAELRVPAQIPPHIEAQTRELAIRTFRTICCQGMARVDFFLKKDGKLYVNEINTIPGFTRISMYPRLWQASGMSYRELVDRLIQLALERFQRESRLRTWH